MSGNLYIGVTDGDWFRFLASRAQLKPSEPFDHHIPSPPDGERARVRGDDEGSAGLDEVNFWQPSGGRAFRVLQPGEMFLFKLHSPQNFTVGGGFFAHFSALPVSLAWETFGEANGAVSYDQMRSRIEKYRRIPASPHEDYQVGCILLEEPFFFPREAWIPIPEDWSSNIVQGKHFSLDSATGRDLMREVTLRLGARRVGEDGKETPELPMYGEPTLMRPRLGQGTFRVLVTDTYGRHCAVTGEKTLPVLDAAHIKPVDKGGRHLVENGLLLRSDIHRLFDRGYVTVSPDYRFRVSPKLRKDYQNGRVYYDLNGRKISLPPDPADHPRKEFLEWHGDEVFGGGSLHRSDFPDW